MKTYLTWTSLPVYCESIVGMQIPLLRDAWRPEIQQVQFQRSKIGQQSTKTAFSSSFSFSWQNNSSIGNVETFPLQIFKTLFRNVCFNVLSLKHRQYARSQCHTISVYWTHLVWSQCFTTRSLWIDVIDGGLLHWKMHKHWTHMYFETNRLDHMYKGCKQDGASNARILLESWLFPC